MKKRTAMLLFFAFIALFAALQGYSKQEATNYGSTPYSDSKTLKLVSDTTITGIWDGGGKVLRISDHRIHGRGTLQNWIIDAPLTQWIFDTSINLRNIDTYGDRFSTAWYGTKSTNADNWWNLQKSINICMDDHLNCFTPGKGVYRYSKTLEVSSIGNNMYQQCSLHFFGDASYWDNGLGTTFQYTGKTGPGFNMQLNKGSEIDHVVFSGLWKSPTTPDSIYYKTTEANYKDVSGNHLPDYYAGVTVDWHPPIDGRSASGSTGIYLHEISIGGFAMALAMSQNGITLNDDNMTVDHIYFLGNHKYCIVNGQAQEKGMHFTNIYSWGSTYDVVNMGFHGQLQAGNYSFDVFNIAGRCIQPFDMSVAHWYSISIDHCFAESIARVGVFSAQIPVTIDHSNFDLVYATTIGRQIIINSNSSQVEFDHTTIRYYDNLNTDVWVHGNMTFGPGCYFGGGKVIYK